MAIHNVNKVNREFLLLIIPLFIVEFVRGAFIISYLPGLSIHPIGISITVIGVAISIHFIGDALSNLISGYMMDHLSSNVVIHLSLLFSTLGLFIVALWTNGFTIILSTPLLGIGVCPLWLVMLSKASGEGRGQKISLVYLGWLLGIGVGMIVMNFLIQYHIKFILWMFPILMVVSWISFSLFNKGSVSFQPVKLKKQWDITIRLLKKSRVVMPGILLQGIAMGMLIPILPSFAINQLHLTNNQYSLLLLLGGGSAVICLIPIGKLVDIMKNKQLLFISGFSLFSIALFTLSARPNMKVTMTVVILLAYFMPFFYHLGIPLLQVIFPKI